MQEYFLKSYIETRAVEIANYIVENNATVRQAAKQFGISKSNPLCTRISRMLTGCFALTRSLPQKRVTFSISTSQSAISAADLPPERSICICLMCMPAECMDASIPALAGAPFSVHLRLFVNSRPVSHDL